MLTARQSLRLIRRGIDARFVRATGVGFEVHSDDLQDARAELDALRLNRPDGVHRDGGDNNDDEQDQHDGTLPQPSARVLSV